MSINTYKFRKIKIYSGSIKKIFNVILSNVDGPAYICMIEASGIMRSMKDKVLLKAFNMSLCNVPDGTPIAWYGKLTGHNKTERISGVDIFSTFIESDNYCRHFLLGDTDETISKVIEIAKAKNPNLQISGYSPPFKNKFSKEDNEKILRQISSFSADIIWVSFGLPKQEKWMLHTHKNLGKGLMIGVGAAFRYYIGDIWCPPDLIQKVGMQWTSRLIENPINYLRNEFLARIRFLYILTVELAKYRLKS